MKDGDQIIAMPRGSGGGKRALSSKGVQNRGDALNLLKEELEMSLFRIATHKNMSPVIDTVVQQVESLKEALLNETFKIEDMLKNLSVKELQALLSSAVSSGTRPEGRCKAVGDIVLSSATNRLKELSKQAEISHKMLTAIVNLIFLTNMADDYSNIKWSTFVTTVSNTIKDKVAQDGSEGSTAKDAVM